MVARDVAYELIPFMQRRQLHAKLAEVLGKDGSTVPPTIVAYHWAQSCKASNNKDLDPSQAARIMQADLQQLLRHSCNGISAVQFELNWSFLLQFVQLRLTQSVLGITFHHCASLQHNHLTIMSNVFSLK